MRQYLIPLESKTEWEEALKGIRHSFAHTWENCHSMFLTTSFRTFLYCYENNGVKIICPYSEREYNGFTDIVTPYGFSGFAGNKDCPEFKESWREFVKSKNYVCGYISQNPLLQNSSYYSTEEIHSPTNLFFIDLKLSLTELFENLDSNRKRIIKNFRSSESEFIYDRDILKEFFISNYNSFLKRINASEANYFSTETLEYICSLGNVFMAGAGENNKVTAVYIFSYTEYAGDCFFNVALDEGRKFSPLLLWCGMKFFKSRKIPVMNLGGGIKEDDSVALSKERFGAYKLPCINLKQIYDKKVYDQLCSEKGVDANDMSGYFPAYRKHLAVSS